MRGVAALTLALYTRVQDTADTSSRSFLKLDCGMTEVLRPSLCAARLRMRCTRVRELTPALPQLRRTAPAGGGQAQRRGDGPHQEVRADGGKNAARNARR